MNGPRAETQKITRNNLVTDLELYIPTDAERPLIPQFLKLLQSEKCFHRKHFLPGHITASSILINKDNDLILMNYHKSLNRWLNFGGHCDGEEDVLAVAIRETMEESGLTAFKPVTADIVDIDIHTIPAHPDKGEPEHVHFDIRYVMRMTENQKPVVSEESLKLEWMTFNDARSVIEYNDSLHRLINKVMDLVQ